MPGALRVKMQVLIDERGGKRSQGSGREGAWGKGRYKVKKEAY